MSANIFDILNINIEKAVSEFFIKWSILCPENVENLTESITQLINNEDDTENKTIIMMIKKNQACIGLPMLSQLAETFNSKSMILILTTENFNKFFINWKVRDSEKFYKLEKIDEKSSNLNVKEFYGFLIDFLVHCLSTNHSGLPYYFNPPTNLITVDIHHLVDPQNFNLLQHAAELGDVKVIEFLINLEIFNDQPCSPINPQSLALQKGQFEAIYIMISKNFSYPLDLDINNCSDDVRGILKASHELHQAIKLKNIEKVAGILDQNINLKHFYNLNNESAIKVAIQHKAFKIYDILLSHGVRLGPHESLNKICKDLTESNSEKILSINIEHSIGDQSYVLYCNSYLSHDSKSPQNEFELIKKAYETLRQVPMMAAVMNVVEAYKNFKIIFDFCRDSVNEMDPTVDGQDDGVFYLTGIILIGAKGLLDPSRKFEVLGCLAHQLCHFAMNLAYDYMARPYKRSDKKSKEYFNEISAICKIKNGKERIIDMIFKCYPEQMIHAELIVTVPHLMFLYRNNPEKLMWIMESFAELFQYFEHKVVPDLQKAVLMVQKKAQKDARRKDKIIKILIITLAVVVGILTIIFLYPLVLIVCK